MCIRDSNILIQQQATEMRKCDSVAFVTYVGGYIIPLGNDIPYLISRMCKDYQIDKSKIPHDVIDKFTKYIEFFCQFYKTITATN